MNSNSFYKIRIEYRHSHQWSWNDPNKSYLRLVWAQEVIRKETKPGGPRYDPFGIRKNTIISSTITEKASFGMMDSGGGGDLEINGEWLTIIR